MGEVTNSVISKIQKNAETQMKNLVEQAGAQENQTRGGSIAKGFGDMLSFGNLDEIIASIGYLGDQRNKLANAPFNKNAGPPIGYDARKSEAQADIAEAQKAYPGYFLTGQVGGAVAPAFTPGGLPVRIANILSQGPKSWKAWATASGLGITASSLDAMGEDKFLSNPVKAMTDGIMWGIGGWAMGGVGNRIAPPMIDFLKRTWGNKLSDRAQQMLIESVTKEGVTPDQAIIGIMKTLKKEGLSPVEQSKDLTDLVDNLANTNPEVMKLVKTLLHDSGPDSTKKLKGILQEDLVPGAESGDNIAKMFDKISSDLKKKHREHYSKVFQTWINDGNVPPQDLVNAVHHILKNDTDFARIMSKKIQRNKLKEGSPDYTAVNDFFKIEKDGKITMLQPPNLEAMEIMRRALGKRAGNIFKNASADLDADDADIFLETEMKLRKQIDEASEASVKGKKGARTLGGVREEFATDKFAVEQFDFGRNLLSRGNTDNERLMIDLEKVLESGNENAVRYLKMGFMNKLNNMFKKASSSAGSDATELDKFLTKLAKKDSNERSIYEALFPDADITGTIKQAKRTLEARRVSGKILGGPSTAKRLSGGLRAEKGPGLASTLAESAVDTMTMGAPVRSMFSKIKSLSTKFKGKMSDKELLDLTRFALSRNPDFLEKALNMSEKKSWETISNLGNRLYGTAPFVSGMLGERGSDERLPIKMF